MGDWRPIDTAPKDGTRVLVWDKAGGEQFVASWMETNNTHEWVYAVVVTDFNYYETACWPTHWMPLPEKPTEQE